MGLSMNHCRLGYRESMRYFQNQGQEPIQSLSSRTLDQWFSNQNLGPTIFKQMVRFTCKANESDVVDVPLLAFKYLLPSEGMPILHSWVSTLKSILCQGFEPWREAIEVKCIEGPTPFGGRIEYSKVTPVKGLGRLSMLLWSVVHTYIHCEQKLEDESYKADFLRPTLCQKITTGYVHPHYRYKSIVFGKSKITNGPT